MILNLNISLIGTVRDCEALRYEWTELLETHQNATPFETFEWTVANLASFENDGIRILVFRNRDGILVGILPFVRRRGRRYTRTRDWWELAGMPHADYGACIVRQGFELKVAEDFIEHLRSTTASWDAIHLEKLRERDPFISPMMSVARSHNIYVVCRMSHQIRRLTRQTYATKGSAGVRPSKSLIRARKRLEALGKLNFEVSTEDQTIQDRLDRYFQMHIERFASKGLQSPFVREQHKKFFRTIAHECAPRGYVRLCSLCVNGFSIATKLTLTYGHTMHLYSTCFAKEFSQYSPSMLHLDMLLQYAFANQIAVVDFGIGESPQKEQAGAIVEETLVQIELYKKRLPLVESQLFHAVSGLQEKSGLLRKSGKLLRKLLPYRM